MVRVGIKGGETPAAGELLRLLINHPDIDDIWISAPSRCGSPVTAVHYGLDGDTDLRFSDPDTATETSSTIVFDCTDPLRIGVSKAGATDDDTVVFGLPELNRKALVRGAMRAVTPHPSVTAVALMLLPLAKTLLLDSPIEAKVSLPAEYATDPGCDARTISEALSELQADFDQPITIACSNSGHPRLVTATVTMKSDIDAAHVRAAFDEFYDDHNLTFIIDRKPVLADVAGTAKCLIYIEKPDASTLRLTAAFDGALKSTAGQALHVMDLLLGLHERVGLALKASGY